MQAIGEGGMGVVYMAEQEKPVRRRVALKIIKPGMDTSQVIARFEAERQALALMDHQHIAKVGFPLGGTLGTITESTGNPSVTIIGGMIAALRRDDHGQVSLFHVDGSLQPGNSGGPIVEARTGKFVGVGVANFGSVNTIGFVVRADAVRRALAGEVRTVEGTRFEGPQRTADLHVCAVILDPRGLIESVAVHVSPASGVTISPNSDGSWPPLPNTDRLNERVVPGQNGVPTRVIWATEPLEMVEDCPPPVEPPASLWDGWLEGFAPGTLARASARDWRRQ